MQGLSVVRRITSLTRFLFAGILLAGCFVMGEHEAKAQSSVVFSGAQTTVSTGSITLNSPSGLAISANGTLYIADTGNKQIVYLPSSGNAAVLGISGLASPQGIAVDRSTNVNTSGNLYIADSLGIFKVTANGTVSQTPIVPPSNVGNLSGASGLAIDSSGNLYIADTGNNRIVELSAPVDGSVGTKLSTGTLSLSGPQSLAFDAAGNLYIADTNNSQIVEIPVSKDGLDSSKTHVVPINGLVKPNGLVIDASGNIYISDSGTNRVTKFTTTGNTLVLGTNGLTMSSPANLAVDASGDLYIADSTDNKVAKLEFNSPDMGAVTVGTASSALLNFTFSSSTTLGSVNVFTLGATNKDFTLGSGTTGADCTPSTQYSANQTCTLKVTLTPTVAGLRAGAVTLMDTSSNVLITAYLQAIGQGPQLALGPGNTNTVDTGAEILKSPMHTATDGSGNLYIADSTHNQIVKISPQGAASSVSITGLGLNQPSGIAVDGAGNLFISDTGNQRIVEVTAQGMASVININNASINNLDPQGLTIDGKGTLYIADANNNRIVKIPAGGAADVVAKVSLSSPYDIAVDGPGNLYIADSGNNRVIQLSTAGTTLPISTGTISLNMPKGLAVAPSGSIYIADSQNNQIVKVTPQGTASAISLKNQNGAMALSKPSGIALDASGNLYIADTGDSQILAVNYAGTQIPTVSYIGAQKLSFNPTNKGLTSSDSPLTLTAENIGNHTLTMSDISLGSNDTSFSLHNAGDSACLSSNPLTPGSSCNYGISFTPQGVGNFTGTATITDNSLNKTGNQQAVALSGTGLDPEASFSISGNANIYINVHTETYKVTALNDTKGTDIGYNGTLTVNVTDSTGATAIKPAPQVTLTDGVGSFTLPALATPGSYTLSVTSANNAVGSFTVTAAKDPTTVSASASSTSIITGASVTLTATVSSSEGTPTGDVSFMDGATNLGKAPLDSKGAASISIPNLAIGTHSITVVYDGDATFDTSTSAVVAITVSDKTATTVTLSASATTVTAGTNVAFTATVSGSGGTPSGTVTFLDGTASLGSGTLNAQGAATFSTNTLTVGTHQITATYSGDASFAGSTSTSMSVTVNAIPAGYTAAINPTSVTIKQGATGTATITITPTGGFTGTFSFSCAGLPAYSNCVFQPTTLKADGSNQPLTATLTINTNVSATSEVQKPWSPANSSPVLPAALFCIPGGLMGYLLMTRRKRAFPKVWPVLILLVMALGTLGLTACGGGGSMSGSTGGSSGSGGSTSSPTTPVGTSTATITVANSTGSVASQPTQLSVVITN